jgi:hypothetical protein
MKEFLAVDSNLLNGISYRSELIVESTARRNVSVKPICLRPLSVACNIGISSSENALLIFKANDDTIASIPVSPVSVLDVAGEPVTVLRANNGSEFSAGLLKRLYYYFRIHFKKRPVSFSYYWARAALFFEPRPVILVAVKCDEFENVFPMDLHLETTNTHVFGLRRTNEACSHLDKKSFRMSIARVSIEHKHELYELGKAHYGKRNALSDGAIITRLHGNRFPEYICEYEELEIIHQASIGEQKLISARRINQVVLKNCGNPLHHFHTGALL